MLNFELIAIESDSISNLALGANLNLDIHSAGPDNITDRNE